MLSLPVTSAADEVTAPVAVTKTANKALAGVNIVTDQPLRNADGTPSNVGSKIAHLRTRGLARHEAINQARQKAFDDAAAALPTQVSGPPGSLVFSQPNGTLVYWKTNGTVDAGVIGVNKIWIGGSSAGNLNGGGLCGTAPGSVIGDWEANVPYDNHVEFGGIGRMVDFANWSFTDNHATSVAGVLAAAGVQPLAKGMAYTATVWGNNWNSVQGDIAALPLSAMRVSNHSYGATLGWDAVEVLIGPYLRYLNFFMGDIDASRVEPIGFGLYDTDSRLTDETAYLQPYNLQVFAAGNSRGRNNTTQLKFVTANGVSGYFVAIRGVVANASPEFVIYNGVQYWKFTQGSLLLQNAGLSNESIIFTSNAGQVATLLSGTPLANGGTTGYDTIPSGAQVSKNTLTVGSVTAANGIWTQAQTATVIGQGTTFGPVDDGRIKPDVVANGVNIYTPKATDANGVLQTNQYEVNSATGTSFASPGVAGGTALLAQLQERYDTLVPGNSLWGPKEPLRAATLKALIIQTATDLPPTGPDYKTGWGVAQIDKAASLIQTNYNSGVRSFIKETFLPNNGEIAFTVKASGGQPVKVTACWADPVAQPDPLTNTYPDLQQWTLSNPTTGVEPSNAVLNNNLDVRIYPIVNNTTNPPTLGTAVLPWKLNRTSPATAATRGQNDVDNVEQVQTPSNPIANTLYRVVITQKAGTTLVDVDGDTAPDSQPISITATGIFTIPENFVITGQSFAFAGGNVTATLTWNSTVGEYYQIECSTNLQTWTLCSGVFNPTKETTVGSTNSVPAGSAGFFRIRKVAPNPFNL